MWIILFAIWADPYELFLSDIRIGAIWNNECGAHEKEIEQYGKRVSMRPSKVHKSKKDYGRKKNKVGERDLE